MILLTRALLVLAAASSKPLDELDPQSLVQKAARCGNDELPWHRSWEEARAAAEGCGRILVVSQTQAGYQLPDAFRLGPLGSPELVEIIRHRYVLFEFLPGSQAPFVAPEVYGMGPSTFGASVLVVDLDGRVLDTCGRMEDPIFRELLVRNLPGELPEPAELSKLEQAEWSLARGQDRRARAALELCDGPRAHRLRARLHRHARDGEAALSELQAGIRIGGPEAARDLALEEAKVQAGLDRPSLALEALQRIPADHADAREAGFLRGSLLLSVARRDEAVEVWKQQILAEPDDRWASYAAASLLYVGLVEKAGGVLSTAWPGDRDVQAARPIEWAPLPARELPRIRTTALEALLALQELDGSWSTGFGAGPVRSSHPLVIGTTAWGARALLRHLERPRARAAFHRAMDFLHGSRRRLAADGEPFGAMDYFVWSKPSLILLLSEGIAAGELDEDEWLPVMEDLVDELRGKQRGGGGWCYYQGTDLQNLEARLEISFSFVTAYNLHALHAAADTGVALPEGMVENALRCLEASRNADGTFEYTLMHADESHRGPPTPSGSAGRGPLCRLAQHRWGAAGPDEVEAALRHFLDHRAAYAREHGKTLMHCGLEGEGSHYLFFDYAWCAAAYAALDPERRAGMRRPLLEQILAARTVSGSFVDNPLIGQAFATAAALCALEQLADEAD